ncbi:MAG TPA: poly-gamma-glutamate synthase PgsB [Pirellulales bacterium]|nr:poly-gamma-glutamate synthase PgsB [Pirellulales bacterium]
MKHVSVLVGFLALLVILGWIEQLLHRRRLKQLRIRIHVNGSRGKSSVTRLIAAGLRAAGIATVAKTTGTLPRLILPDGRERPIPRGCRPTVLEQIGVVRAATATGAEALVVECMALTPSLQWLSERQLIQATHCVITGAREDHLDVMGPTERDVALALAGTIPPHGTLLTADERYTDVYRRAADDRHCSLLTVSPAEVDQVTEVELARFSYIEHAENVALALAACAAVGVARDAALAGMQQSMPDPGALMIWHVCSRDKEIWFVNGLAANDPRSSETIWNFALARFPLAERRLALFNCRGDRPERSWRLGQAYAAWQAADRCVLIGGGVHHFARAAGESGLDMQRVVLAPEQTAEAIFDTLIELAAPTTLIVGLGNIGGLGLELIEHVRSLGVPCLPTPSAGADPNHTRTS